MKTSLHIWIGSIFIMIAGGCAGYWLLQYGFIHIQELRQLERVPEGKAGAMLPGEVTITAWALQDSSLKQPTIISRYTKTPSLYYRYTREIEETDSDGDKHWRTLENHQDSVRFFLEDESGKVVLNPKQHGRIDWSVQRSFRVRIGDIRHTEWRIEPGEQLFVFAKAELHRQAVELRFPPSGYYTPIVSNYSRAHEQAEMGGHGLLALGGGFASLAMMLLGMVFIFKIHRLIAYIGILTFLLVIVLVSLSLSMMRQDLKNGLERYHQQYLAAEHLVKNDFKAESIPWAGWNEAGDFYGDEYYLVSEVLRYKWSEYRKSLALSQVRLAQQMEAVPERYLYRLWGFEKPPEIKGIPSRDLQLISNRLLAQKQTKLVAPWTFVVMILGVVLAVLFTFLGYRRIRTKRLIEAIPSSPTAAVSCGLAEVTGVVQLMEGDQALVSPYTASDCVWYRYKLECRVGSGKNRSWVVMEKDSQEMEFLCKDEGGVIAVDPEKAEVISTNRLVRREGDYRYTEDTLRVNDSLYVIGFAAIDQYNKDKLKLQKAKGDPFVLSNLSESQVMFYKARAGMFFLNVAFGGMLLAMLLGFGRSGGFAATDFLIAALVAPVYMMLITLALHYNDLVYLRQRTERNWANIQVSLKKRRSLVNSLQRIAKRYFEHEKELFERLTLLRTDFKSAVADDKQLSQYFESERTVHQQLNFTLERYPELKSNVIISKLMATLSMLETELSLYRQGYNDSVELYNQRIATVPDVFFAKAFGFYRQGYFDDRS